MNNSTKPPMVVDVNVLFDAVNLHSQNHEPRQATLRLKTPTIDFSRIPETPTVSTYRRTNTKLRA